MLGLIFNSPFSHIITAFSFAKKNRGKVKLYQELFSHASPFDFDNFIHGMHQSGF